MGIVFLMVVGSFSSCARENTHPTPIIQIEQTKDTIVYNTDYGVQDSIWYEIERQKFLDSLFLIDLKEMYGITSLHEYYDKHDSLILGHKYNEYYGK